MAMSASREGLPSMGSSGLSGFWTSIINDGNIQKQLRTAMGVEDVEERALALLSRTLFLLIMEIKFERDEAVKLSEAVMGVIDGCHACREKVTTDASTNKTAVNPPPLYTDSQPDEDRNMGVNTLSGGINEVRQHSGDDKVTRGSTGDCVEVIKEVKSHSLTPRKVQSLTMPQEVDREGVSIPGTQTDEDILVPATMDVMASQSLESSMDRTFITQKVFVPETVCMDDHKPHDVSDIFEDCEEGNATQTQTCTIVEPQTPDIWHSPVKSSGKMSPAGRDNQVKLQDKVRITKLHRDSHSNTTQQRQIATVDLELDVYTEDVTVESDGAFRSPISVTAGSRTPNKTGCKTPPDGSPVFGKGNRLKRNPQATADAKRNISTALSIEQARTDITRPQNNTPDKSRAAEKGKSSPGTKRLKGNTTAFCSISKALNAEQARTDTTRPLNNTPSKRETPEKGKNSPGGRRLKRNLTTPSPKPSPHNISDDITSPSLLQPFASPSLLQPFASSSATKGKPAVCSNPNTERQPGGTREVEVLPSPKGMLGPSSSRRVSLRRRHTADGRRTGGTKMLVSPPDQHGKNTGYRQTRVDHFLTPHSVGTKASGGGDGVAARRVFLDDEEALRLAVAASLGLQAPAATGRREGSGTSPSPRKAHGKESPIKLPNLRRASTSPKQALGSVKKSPDPAPRSHVASPSETKPGARRKILEEKECGKEGNDVEKGKHGERKEKNEIKMDVKDEGREGIREEDEGKTKTGGGGCRKRKMEEEEEEEVVVKEVKENVGPRKGEGKTPPPPLPPSPPSPPARKAKRAVFHESFDILPKGGAVPQYAHQGEVVRKKDARKQLEGWPCKQCQEFYEKAGSSTQEVKELMNKCSRHRSKYKPLSNTPEGFWNPFFDD